MNHRTLLQRMAELHAQGKDWLTSADLVQPEPPHPSNLLRGLFLTGLLWRRPSQQRGRGIYEYRIAEQARDRVEEDAPMRITTK